jgi:hypothetical protein
MKHKPLTRIVAITLVAASLVPPAFGILGVGDIVFDPTNYGSAVQRLIQLQQQYAQLVQTYQMIQNQYQQMMWMARQVPVSMGSRYRMLSTPWLGSSATNTYGTTAGWITAVNQGLNTSQGYLQAVQKLESYGPALGNIPADQLPRVTSNYATVELTDGANLSALETIGRVRANAPSVELAIQDLEDDSLSSDSDMNTEIAVLNKINAAHIMTVRNTQDTNKLLVALTEEQTINAKRTRDAESQAIDNHIRFKTDGQAAINAQASGASSAMMSWQMP